MAKLIAVIVAALPAMRMTAPNPRDIHAGNLDNKELVADGELLILPLTHRFR
jgi:hypothetical protein